MMRHPELKLNVDRLDYHYDELDANTINFIVGDKGLFLSTSLDEEDGDPFDKLYSEYDGQENGRYDAIAAIILREHEILLIFKETMLFMKKFGRVRLSLPSPLEQKTIEFFHDHLMAGSLIVPDEGQDAPSGDV